MIMKLGTEDKTRLGGEQLAADTLLYPAQLTSSGNCSIETGFQL